jgi:hypothetical protein
VLARLGHTAAHGRGSLSRPMSIRIEGSIFCHSTAGRETLTLPGRSGLCSGRNGRHEGVVMRKLSEESDPVMGIPRNKYARLLDCPTEVRERRR